MQILPPCILIWYRKCQAKRTQDIHVYSSTVNKVDTVIYISIYSHLTIYNQHKVGKKSVYL